MSNSLAKARAIMKKRKGIDMENNRIILDAKAAQTHACISTGSIVVDNLIGGNRVGPDKLKQCPGIPRGRITEIYGPYSSGKTTLALEAAASCQRAGGTVVFLDYENALDPIYTQALGVSFDEDKWDMYCPATWEEGAEIIGVLAESGVDMIIVDSVSAMIPQQSYEKDYSEGGRIGMLAACQSRFLPRIVPVLRRGGTALVYLNQVRSRIKTSKYDAGPDEDTSGGKALKFYCSLRICLKPLRQEFDTGYENELTGEAEKQVVSRITRAQITKSKVSASLLHTADFVVRFGEGIDTVRTVIDIAEKQNLVKRAGTWFKMESHSGEEIKHQGKEKLRAHLLTSEVDYTHLLAQMEDVISTRNGGLISDEEVEYEDVDDEEDSFVEVVS
jgi:recombination protein RecA